MPSISAIESKDREAADAAPVQPGGDQPPSQEAWVANFVEVVRSLDPCTTDEEARSVALLALSAGAHTDPQQAAMSYSRGRSRSPMAGNKPKA